MSTRGAAGAGTASTPGAAGTGIRSIASRLPTSTSARGAVR